MTEYLNEEQRASLIDSFRAALEYVPPGLSYEPSSNGRDYLLLGEEEYLIAYPSMDSEAALSLIVEAKVAGPVLLAENDALRAKVERMEKRESIILGWFMNHDYECPPEMAKQPLDCIQGCPLCLRQWADSIIDEQAIKEGKTNE